MQITIPNITREDLKRIRRRPYDLQSLEGITLDAMMEIEDLRRHRKKVEPLNLHLLFLWFQSVLRDEEETGQMLDPTMVVFLRELLLSQGLLSEEKDGLEGFVRRVKEVGQRLWDSVIHPHETEEPLRWALEFCQALFDKAFGEDTSGFRQGLAAA